MDPPDQTPGFYQHRKSQYEELAHYRRATRVLVPMAAIGVSMFFVVVAVIELLK